MLIKHLKLFKQKAATIATLLEIMSNKIEAIRINQVLLHTLLYFFQSV